MTTRSERADERRLQAVAHGLEAAQQAIHAIADDEDEQALAILNRLTYADSQATSTVLLACLRAVATALADGDPSETRRRLHAAADGITGDGAVAQAEAVVAAAFSRTEA